MLKSKHVLGAGILLCLLAALALADQPFMRAARADLQQARAQLQAALANKGGHRVKAIEHVNKAIAYVNDGIVWDRRHNHMFAGAFKVSPDQPHMQAALDHLLLANENLERATFDRGVYLRKAIDEINKAIDETKKGIEAGE
jgi:tetratricopeptide (TPR) repeat protein